MVKDYGSPPALTRPHPVIRTDVLDEDGNLRGADIGITWAGNETFLHGVRVVGPGPPRPSGIGPAMSTPYQPTRDHDMENRSTSTQPPTPSTPLTVPDAEIQLRRPPQEMRQGYRPASDQFDLASMVSASRSRFHGRFRRHHEDADAFADALAKLCRVGYPQSPPELRQELIAEQFVRGKLIRSSKSIFGWWSGLRRKGNSILLLKFVRTSPGLTAPTHTHRPAEETFAVHQPMEASFVEEDCKSEAMFAVGDRPPWTDRGASEPSGSPTLQQMF